MTDTARLWLAMILSWGIHYGVLHTWAPPPPATSGLPLRLEQAATEIGISLAPPILLQSESDTPPQDTARADQRRAALAAYSEKLTEAAHAQRSVRHLGRSFVGHARFRIVIDAAGQFSAIRLLSSSGNAKLDADAHQAILHISGTIPRPVELGKRSLAIDIAVKYQFGL